MQCIKLNNKFRMKYVFVGGGILLVAVVVVWNVNQNNTTDTSLTDDIPATQPTAANNAETQPSEVTQNEVENIGTYQVYSPEALAASTATHNILIFSATWCPSCRALDNDIADNIGEIPSDVALFTVDYDTNIDLRQTYGVTTQHTLVLVESDGTEIKKWVGGNTLNALLANI